jgi:hypothetical protein
MGKIKIMGEKNYFKWGKNLINPPTYPATQNHALQGEIRRVWARIKN